MNVMCCMHLRGNSEQCVQDGKVTLANGKVFTVLARFCVGQSDGKKMPITKDDVREQEVVTLRDSGCDGVLVKRSLVNEDFSNKCTMQ